MANIIAAILVNYNAYTDTVACIDSLMAGSLVPRYIIVVDNASPDGSGRELQAVYATSVGIEVILSPMNNGFGAANNLGARRAAEIGCTHLLILNNDVVVDKEMLSVLSRGCADGQVTVPLMLYHVRPDIIWYAGGCFNRFCIPRHCNMGKTLAEVSLIPMRITFVTGCCLLIALTDYNAVGGFDERYFLYWEDTDLSIRLAKAGVTFIFLPDARLYHKVSASTGGECSPIAYYYMTRNRLYGIRKNRMGVLPLAWAVLAQARALLSPNPMYQYAHRAWADALRGITGKMPDVDQNR